MREEKEIRDKIEELERSKEGEDTDWDATDDCIRALEWALGDRNEFHAPTTLDF